MMAYLVISGVVFLLVLVAHVFSFVAEGAQLYSDLLFIASTMASAALCLWAARLLLALRPPTR